MSKSIGISSLLFTLFICHIHSSSSPLVPLPNPYFFSNSVAFLTTNDPSLTYNITFVTATEMLANDAVFGIHTVQNDVASTPFGTVLEIEFGIYLLSVTQSVLQVYYDYYTQTPWVLQFRFRYLLYAINNPISQFMSHTSQYTNSGNTNLTFSLPAGYVVGDQLSIGYYLTVIEYGKNQMMPVTPFTLNISTIAITSSSVIASYSIGAVYAWMYIEYSCLILDLTQINKNPNFVIDSGNLTATSPQTTLSYPFSLTPSFAPRLMGLYSFKVNVGTSDPTFQFASGSSGNSFLTSFISPYVWFSFNYLAISYQECPNNYEIYNSSDSLCYDGCLVRFYHNHANHSCMACPYDCLTCTNNSLCLNCSSSDFRLISSNRCVSMNGYYDAGVTTSSACNYECGTCVNTASNCLSCRLSTYFNSSGSCKLCQYLVSSCLTCQNDTTCLSCAIGYSLFNATYCAIYCADTNCSLCLETNINYCLICIVAGFKPIYGICRPICGNGLIALPQQQCDDLNTINHDGCSDICQVETGYQCFQIASIINNASNMTSYCRYTLPISFQIITINKTNNKNQINIMLHLDLYQETFWGYASGSLSKYFQITGVETSDITIQFLSNDSSSSTSLSHLTTTTYPSSSLLFLTFQYYGNVELQSLLFSFDFSLSQDQHLNAIPPLNQQATIQSSDELLAYFYSQNTYDLQNLMLIIFTILTYTSLAVYVCSIFLGGKRITSQLVTILQISFLSMISFVKVTPLMYPLTNLSLTCNGFNIASTLLNKSSSTDALTPSYFKGMQIYAQFFNNFNFGALLIYLPLIFACILFIISKCTCFSPKILKSIKKLLKKAIFQVPFMGLIFAGYPTGVFLILEIKYGISDLSTMFGLISVALPALILVTYLIYTILVCKYSKNFGEFTQIYKESDKFSTFLTIFNLLFRLFFGIILAFLTTLGFQNGIICFVFVAMLILIYIKEPFKKLIDHIRTVCNYIVLAGIQAVFLYLNLNSSNNFLVEDENQNLLKMPFTICLLLSAAVLYNVIFFFVLIIQQINEYCLNKQKQQAENIQNQYISTSSAAQAHKFINNQLLIKPLDCKNANQRDIEMKEKNQLLEDMIEIDSNREIINQDQIIEIKSKIKEKYRKKQNIKVKARKKTKINRINEEKQQIRSKGQKQNENELKDDESKSNLVVEEESEDEQIEEEGLEKSMYRRRKQIEKILKQNRIKRSENDELQLITSKYKYTDNRTILDKDYDEIDEL